MANKQDENVELIDEEVITLYDDDNNPVDFNEEAVVEYEGDFYALLTPVKPMEGLAEDEALIFKIIEEDRRRTHSSLSPTSARSTPFSTSISSA